MRRKLIKYTIIALILVAIGWTVVASIQGANAPKKVTTVEAQTDTLEVTISANGKLESPNTVDLRFTGTGRITYLPYKEGDSVKKNQVLAYLDGTVTSQQVTKATADLRLAIEKIREYEYDHKDKPRTDEYYQGRWQLDAQRDASEALLAQSRAGYLDKTITSPIEGVISKINGTVGEVPPAADPVITVVDPSQIEFVAEVDEQDIGEVRHGQGVEVLLDAYSSKTLSGTVRHIETIARTGTTGNTYFPVKITLNPTDSVLLLGMNGDATITTAKKDTTLLIPLDVIFEENDKNYVYLINNGVAQKREVTVGLQSDSETEVLSGVTAGDQIISGDVSQIKDGTKVTTE